MNVFGEKGINSDQLKVIAIVSMTMDHLMSVIFPNYPMTWWILLIHIFGRLAAPIFWFMVCEGYHYTHDLKKYIERLFVFAVISHFAYNFAFGIPFIPFTKSPFNQTSVIWTLMWGVVALAITDENRFQLKHWQKVLAISGICVLTLGADWSCFGVLAILEINSNRGDLKKQVIGMMKWVACYALARFISDNKIYGILQLFVIICVPFIKCYNGERGKWKGMKWFFYVYYPLHLFLLGLLRIYLYGNISVMIGG